MRIKLKGNFPLGRIVATTGALGAISCSDIVDALSRHTAGDWGDVCPEDRAENDRSVKEGHRLLSAYSSEGGTRFWVITEGDRSVTTVLLPDEY